MPFVRVRSPSSPVATSSIAGSLRSTVELKRLMADSEIPIYYALGNHDLRGPFLEVFSGPGAQTDENGFVQYTVDFGPMRMLVCDTLEGENDGGYDEVRADWLPPDSRRGAGPANRADPAPSADPQRHPLDGSRSEVPLDRAPRRRAPGP